MKRKFVFIFPLTVGKVDIHRKNFMRYDHVGDLLVSGSALDLHGNVFDSLDERYTFDIDEVMFNGVNIYPVISATDLAGKIDDACYHHIHHMFTGQQSDYDEPNPESNSLLPAKVITLPLKRKVN